MDGGANHGPPQTPSLSKSMELWWRAKDKAHCAHTSGLRMILLNKPPLLANVLGIFSHGPARSDHSIADRRRRELHILADE